MPIVDMKARTDKEILKIKKAVAAYVKKAGCNTGKITIEPDKGGEWFVEVDNDGLISPELASAINNASEFAKIVKNSDHKGVYDWSSDTYMRPCSCVWFKL